MLLFIFIFGADTRLKTIDEGTFHCPFEGGSRPYERKKAALWVTLYLLPVFPIKQQGEVIKCQSCGRLYPPEVLDDPQRFAGWDGLSFDGDTPDAPPRRPPSGRGTAHDPVALVNNLKNRLADGTPIEYLVRDLTATGYARDVALSLIDAQLGQVRAYCTHCSLTYAPSVARCTECNQPLN